jgi:hypothetical protein
MDKKSPAKINRNASWESIYNKEYWICYHYLQVRCYKIQNKHYICVLYTHTHRYAYILPYFLRAGY